ncbi:MAG: DUF732 domain-containing protein [Dietzia sp.]
MRGERARSWTAAMLVAVVAATAACGAEAADPVDERTAAATPDAVASDSSGGTVTAAGTPARSADERAFLTDLAGFGLPTEMTAETTLEVGLGICGGIEDGADTETILERIRPLTSAIAAQSDEWDTARVGRALIEASRARLCD